MRKAADLLPRFVRRLGARTKSKPVIVGVSGGCDSVVLLDLLQRAGFEQLVVAHMHHGLRGKDADRDKKFVRGLADAAGLKFVSARGKTTARAARNKESIEEAARKLRRVFFSRAAKRHQAKTIFLAHQANDAAETMLFHLARGSGRRGLGSLREEAPLDNSTAVIVRPLLGFTRKELESYAHGRKLSWREDESNASREFTRNRLRHDVIPRLAKATGHDPVPAMARAAEIFAAEEDWLDDLFAPHARAVQLDVRALRRMHVAQQRRLLRAWLGARTRGTIDFETVESARTLAMSKNQPAKMNLPRGHHLRRSAGKLFVEREPRSK